MVACGSRCTRHRCTGVSCVEDRNGPYEVSEKNNMRDVCLGKRTRGAHDVLARLGVGVGVTMFRRQIWEFTCLSKHDMWFCCRHTVMSAKLDLEVRGSGCWMLTFLFSV